MDAKYVSAITVKQKMVMVNVKAAQQARAADREKLGFTARGSAEPEVGGAAADARAVGQPFAR